MRKIVLFIITLSFVGCEFKASTKETTETKETKEPEKKSNSKIRNGIVLKEEGIKVDQAFLIDHEDNLISGENLTKVNQPLRVRLIIDSGLTATDGKVLLGASEKVVTSDGDVVLDEEDLFATVGAVPEKDAKILSLSVMITKINKLVDFYEVKFRVWDKSSNNAVSGSFKFNVE